MELLVLKADELNPVLYPSVLCRRKRQTPYTDSLGLQPALQFVSYMVLIITPCFTCLFIKQQCENNIILLKKLKEVKYVKCLTHSRYSLNVTYLYLSQNIELKLLVTFCNILTACFYVAISEHRRVFFFFLFLKL